MSKMATDYIGDLLRSAGFVTSADLAHAAQVALKTGLPVSRILLNFGLVTPRVVQAATQVHSLIREQHLTPELGSRALWVVANQMVDLEEALKRMGVIEEDNSRNELGELLLAAQIITEEQLADALNASQHKGLPLGRIMVLKGWLSEDHVESVLELLILLRDERINHSQALEVLRTMSEFNVGTREALRRLGCEELAFSSKVRLGELLVMARLLSQTDLLTALEMGLIERQQVGTALIDFGFVDEYVLEAAVALQAMINRERLTPMQACEALNLVAQQGHTILQAYAVVIESELPQEEFGSLLHLLSLAGFLSTDDIHRLLKILGTSTFTNVLTQSGSMNEKTVEVATRCYQLVREGMLTRDQAITALHHWRWHGVSLRDILQDLGWNPQPDPVVLPGLDEPEPAPAQPVVVPEAVPTLEAQLALIASSDRLMPVQEVQTDSENGIHHTWGTPEVQHTWGIPELHHSWH